MLKREKYIKCKWKIAREMVENRKAAFYTLSQLAEYFYDVKERGEKFSLDTFIKGDQGLSVNM